MRGLLFPGERRVMVAQFPDPTPDHGEVAVRIRAAAVCGSDMYSYRMSAER